MVLRHWRDVKCPKCGSSDHVSPSIVCDPKNQTGVVANRLWCDKCKCWWKV